MKKVLLFIIFCLIFPNTEIDAQDSQIVLMSQNGYGQQTWFYCGLGKKLDTGKINQNYKENYLITSVSYTTNGWFVSMSKNAGLTRQEYLYTQNWRSDWLEQKEKKGYYITSISYGYGGWIYVVSQGTGYTDQIWKWDSFDNVKSFITKYWNLDYNITQAEYVNNKWLVVMSKNTQYISQSWSKCPSVSNTKECISQYWNDGKNIQLLEYGGGSYLIIASKLKSGKALSQSYSINQTGISDFISKNWDEGRSVDYIGGGESTKTESKVHQNKGKTVVFDATIPFMNGTTRYILYSDGSGYSENNIPCSFHCYKGKCTICNGTGIAIHPFLGTTTLCTVCNMGKCKYCNNGIIIKTKHWAPGEAQAYNAAVRQLKNAGYNVPERNSTNTGVCPDCNGKGYRAQAYTYAAESSFAPYHNYSGNKCSICSSYSDHYHYRCTTCKRH